MAVSEASVRTFFAAYEARINAALGDPPVVDAEGQAQAFTDAFIEAHPGGVASFTNDAQFLAAVPGLYAAFRDAGTRAMRIASLAVTPIDEFHAMATIHWEAQYRKKDGTDLTLDFDETYLVQMLADAPRIFAYVAGDQQKLMTEHGLIP